MHASHHAGFSQEANLAPTALGDWCYNPIAHTRNSRTMEAGQWGSCRRDESLLDTSSAPSLFLLATQIKTKTQSMVQTGEQLPLCQRSGICKTHCLLAGPSLQDLTRNQLWGRVGVGSSPSQTESSSHISSTHRITNFASALKWLWLFRFQNISRPVRVILYLNYLNAIYPLKQFSLHKRSVFFFRELKHDK